MGAVYALSDTESCKNRTIEGRYGFTLQGTKLTGPPPIGPQVGVAMADFDGEGAFTQIDLALGSVAKKVSLIP